MKKLFTLALIAALAAVVLSGCGKGGGDGDKQIELPDKSEQTQQAFADEETTGDFTFTAKSAWMASVAETTPTKATPITSSAMTRAGGVSWLRLLLNGHETYSGGAGEFTITIGLDPNYTGAKRSAAITITSGGTGITITVTQDGRKEDGTVPVDPTLDPVEPGGTIVDVNPEEF